MSCNYILFIEIEKYIIRSSIYIYDICRLLKSEELTDLELFDS